MVALEQQRLCPVAMTLENGDANWYTFNIRVSAILEHIERVTGIPYTAALPPGPLANRWHMAVREGVRNHLHLNLGIPGMEIPEHPIEENETALLAALLMGTHILPVILSGEWELAVKAGLITSEQLQIHQAACTEQTLL